MFRKFLAVLGREIQGLHEAAYLLAAFAVLSQILALIRDKILAYTFGANPSPYRRLPRSSATRVDAGRGKGVGETGVSPWRRAASPPAGGARR